MHLELLVEDASTEAMLNELLPRILTHTTFAIKSFQGKQDLLGQLPTRLKGYSRWLPADNRIIILLDRDDDDCRILKTRLNTIISAAHLNLRQQVAARIAIEELEAWYFGDGEALRHAYPRLSRTLTDRASYRDPDAIRGGTWEALERELQRAGYHRGGLAKIAAARDIGQHLDPRRNRSQSFRIFVDLLKEFDTGTCVCGQ